VVGALVELCAGGLGKVTDPVDGGDGIGVDEGAAQPVISRMATADRTAWCRAARRILSLVTGIDRDWREVLENVTDLAVEGIVRRIAERADAVSGSIDA
jgi:hypothetical protein